jgi:hypothetical protein
MTTGPAHPVTGSNLAERLNRDCQCLSVNHARLRERLDADPVLHGLYDTIRRTRPHLFSDTAVYLSSRQVEQMKEAIAAIESAVRLPAYREAVMAWADPIARHETAALGVFTACDFHLTPTGPKLIEINTNAGGALLNAVLSRAQHACCDEIADLVSGPVNANEIESDIVDMFRAEWRRAHGSASLVSLAIVDDAPREQYLYPEFLLFQQLFQARGIETVIADPADLSYCHGRLFHADLPVQMVYNRLTDFALTEPRHVALRQAWLDGRVVLTPHPRTHALYADKRNLAVLSDADRLRSLGADAATIERLAACVPRTRAVTAANREEMWAGRRGLFFKPATGYGSKAAYRGDKLTRRVWEEIARAEYVAQDVVMPPERRVHLDGESTPLKFDIRCFVYDGRVQLIAARLYQGQTTNFRTRGGGFAPVFYPVR